MRLPGTFLNQSSDTKIKVKIGQNLKIKSTVKGLSKQCAKWQVTGLQIQKLNAFKGIFPFVSNTGSGYQPTITRLLKQCTLCKIIHGHIYYPPNFFVCKI